MVQMDYREFPLTKTTIVENVTQAFPKMIQYVRRIHIITSFRKNRKGLFQLKHFFKKPGIVDILSRRFKWIYNRYL